MMKQQPSLFSIPLHRSSPFIFEFGCSTLFKMLPTDGAAHMFAFWRRSRDTDNEAVASLSMQPNIFWKAGVVSSSSRREEEGQ